MDQRAIAAYFVLYRLTQQGFSASTTSGGHAELLACTPDGGRVALIRVRTREPNGSFRLLPEDRRPAGRNVSYVFVDFSAGEGKDPSVFVLRGALLLAMLELDPSWPRDAGAFHGLEDCRDAWHLLGLGPKSGVRSVSPC